MNEDYFIARGQRWKLFYEEEGGLRDILADIGRTYIERMSLVEPWETEKLSKLAMANKIVGQLDSVVREIIASGQVAEHAKAHTKKIESLPAAKRRWI